MRRPWIRRFRWRRSDVGFLHQRLDFRFAVAAAVIAAVGDQQERLARVLGLFHFVHRHVDRVEQRGSSFGLGEGELVLDLLQIARERLNQAGGIVELHQEKFVLGIRQFEKLCDCLPGFVELVAHAAAAIEDHAHGERCVLAGKLRDVLRKFVLRQFEVLLLESRYKTVQRVGDGNGDQHQRAVHADIGLWTRLRLLTRFSPHLEICLSPDRSQTSPDDTKNQQLNGGRQHSGRPAFLSQE